MKTKLKIIIATVLLVPFLAFAPVSAEFNPLCPTKDSSGVCTSGACKGNAASSPTCKQADQQGTKDPISGTSGVLSKATDLIALVAGVAALVMIFIGAFFYVTSGGNTENTAKARSRIISALIGLVIVALAWTIVRFVTDKVLQ